MYITILPLFFVRFLLYVVYVFALCSPYLEDNKVSIYLSDYSNNNDIKCKYGETLNSNHAAQTQES